MPPDPGFRLAVKILLHDRRGRCLVLRRSAGSRLDPGRWDLPGGKVDPGEEPAVGLRREVAEETGLRCRVARLLGATQADIDGQLAVCLVLEGRILAGRLRLSPEHEDFAWRAPADLPSIDWASTLNGIAGMLAARRPAAAPRRVRPAAEA